MVGCSFTAARRIVCDAGPHMKHSHNPISGDHVFIKGASKSVPSRKEKGKKNKANPNNNRKSKKAGRSSSSSKCVGLGKRITAYSCTAAIA
jgi:hypothetical protein